MADTGAQGSTPFEVLENIFDKAAPVTEKDLVGWYAGRTVSNYAKYDFEGELLVGRMADINGGELFQDQSRLVLYRYFNDSPAYFEAPKMSEIKNEVATDISLKRGITFTSPSAVMYSAPRNLKQNPIIGNPADTAASEIFCIWKDGGGV